MSLPQIVAGLLACDRRDAKIGLLNLDVIHSANAPLFGGTGGNKAYKKCQQSLNAIANPPTEKQKRESFRAKLWSWVDSRFQNKSGQPK